MVLNSIMFVSLAKKHQQAQASPNTPRALIINYYLHYIACHGSLHLIHGYKLCTHLYLISSNISTQLSVMKGESDSLAPEQKWCTVDNLCAPLPTLPHSNNHHPIPLCKWMSRFCPPLHPEYDDMYIKYVMDVHS